MGLSNLLQGQYYRFQEWSISVQVTWTARERVSCQCTSKGKPVLVNRLIEVLVVKKWSAHWICVHSINSRLF